MYELFCDEQMRSALRPYYPVFSDWLRISANRVRCAEVILGISNKAERANDLHRSIRNVITELSFESQSAGLFEPIEEPEGRGMDYVLFHGIPGAPIAVRWGHLNRGHIHRRRSQRQKASKVSGMVTPMLIDGLDEKIDDAPIVTLGYAIANDYTEASISQWQLSKVVLLRERFDRPELLDDVARYEVSEIAQESPIDEPVVIRPRDAEIQKLADLLKSIRRTA